MESWQQFLIAKPILARIESRYRLLLQLEKVGRESSIGLPEAEQAGLQAAVRVSLKKDLIRLPGPVYSWLHPFYPGDFSLLVAALRRLGQAHPRHDAQSRDAFVQFFRTVPQAERLALGQRLRRPDMGVRSAQLKRAIEAKKARILAHFDQHCAN